MKKLWIITLFALFVLGSCASLSGYKYYVIDPLEMKLLADKPADDLPLMDTCLADVHDKAKCIGMLREEYFKLEKELLQLRVDLKACQGH